MCVDYMGLNKACPKDPFPLPRIDQVVDSTSGCKTLCFLSAYSGYHKVTMKESDQLMTSFITPFGSFHYITRSFGQKNTGLRTNDACSSVSRISSGGPLRPTWMTSWSSPNGLTTSSPTLSRPSQNSEQMALSSTLRCAFLGSQGVCCLVSSSPSVASKL